MPDRPGMDRVVAAVAIGLGVFHLLNVARLQLLSALDIRIVHLAGVFQRRTGRSASTRSSLDDYCRRCCRSPSLPIC